MTGKTPLSEMSREEQRQALFDETEARTYDQSIRKVVPLYDLAHKMVVELLADHLLAQAGEEDHATGTVLDIGAGTGVEALAILQRFSRIRVVAVDLSQSILDVFLRKLRRHSGYRSRCELVCANIMSNECSIENLRRILPSEERETGYQVVISAFTIHHLEHHGKQDLFHRIFEILADRGLFLNLDLFSFQSLDLARQALQFDLSWIDRHFHLDSSTSVEKTSKSDLRRIGQGWKHHYQHYNLTEPTESYCNSTQLPGQEEMLRTVGFRETAVPFRYWQCGILWARK